MIIKKFLNKVNINLYTLILIFLCLITGLFKEMIIISTLVIIHEFGHFLCLYLYNWNVKEITIYPFGGLTILDEKIDKPLKEEFIITIFGPIFQELLFLLIFLLYKENLLNKYIYDLFKSYNITMLAFNLLPIIPLDGFKLLNILLNKFLNFRLSYNINIIISILLLSIFIFVFRNDTSYYLIITFLLYEIYYYVKNKYIYFNRFILEKKLNKTKFIKYKKINNVNKMYRNKRNLIKDKGSYVTEYTYINKSR